MSQAVGQNPGWMRRLLIIACVGVGLLVLGTAAAMAGWSLIAASGAVLTLAPAFSLCLLMPLFFAALVLSVLLYRQQRRMASFGAVMTLTLLRVALILLLAVLFLQPALRWNWKRTSAGTLWVIVDQSPSMQANDAQAAPAERLHWADGMGLVQRSVRPDEMIAEIGVLADELDALTPDSGAGGWGGAGGGGGDESALARAAADRLDGWNARLKTLLGKVSDARGTLNGYSAGAGDRAIQQLDDALAQGRANVAPVRAARSVWEAREALKTPALGAQLHRAAEALAPAAAASDAAFLAQSAGKSDWISASDRLKESSRSDLVSGFLTDPGARAASPLHSLAKLYTMRIGSFSDKAQSAGAVDEHALDDALKASLLPAGSSTNIGSALQFVAEQIPGDEAASVVIISDGRNNTGGDPTAPARNLAARGVHVYGMLIGSHELSPDAAVEPVDFPDWVFAGDSIQARAIIRMDGLQGQAAQVELRRAGSIMETRTVRATTAHAMIPFEFTDKPPETDKVIEYEIRVQQMPGEVNTQNNVATFRVAVKKDKLYALMVEDRPRWEFRYLSAYLARRPGTKLQTVLLQPATVTGVGAPAGGVASPDNPRTEASALPTTLAEWERFDVIVLGDVGPETVTPQMQQFIAATVRDKGATLITIAGQRAMPEKYTGSALAELLPVTLRPQYDETALQRHLKNGFLPESAPTAGMSVLAQLGADASSNGTAWQNMPLWYWHSPFTESKPGAAVAWTLGEAAAPIGVGAGGGGGDGTPVGSIADANRHALLSTLSVGLGHSLYLASDQSWRLRQVGGLNLHDRFWGQVLNWAVGSDLPAGGKYVRFGASQPTYQQSEPVIVTARVLKDDLTPYPGLSFSAVARNVRGTSGETAPGNTVEARFEPMDSPGYYQATLSGLPIGDDEITLQGGEVERLLNSDPTVTLKSVLVKVYPTMNAERQNMNTDPVMLEMITRAGGGFSVDGQYANMLLSRLPRIEHTETSIYQLGFFTDPDARGTRLAHWIFLALFAAIITTEWIMRKRVGLV